MIMKENVGSMRPPGTEPEFVNIGGERFCAGRTELDLYGLTDADIVALGHMTKLKRISFGGDNISDLAPLSGLTNLKELYIRGDNISDLAPLFGLKNLKSIDFFRDC
ncbi:MAG: hypothetical protein LBO03_07050 [Acidaminococcales bacterium]|jgi:Leucine-rich repeat (LRR) protein|nr:hypothetical protein [Acidaminococcales bacterium]